MTKMAAMRTYGKTLQKSSSPSRGIDFKETWHETLMAKYYNVYINHDLVMTMTYFTTRST